MNDRSRAGKSLVELIVVISVLSVMMALCTTSLATLFRLRHQLTRDNEQASALAHLGSRLRQDAHAAVTAAVEEECTFTIPGGQTIQYAFAAPHITREVRKDGALIHRDRFTLPKSATATFEKKGDGSSGLVRLLVRPIEVRTRRTEMPRVATIEAAVGLNGALAKDARP